MPNSPKPQADHEPSMPPLVPESRELLNQALTLLGNRVKYELTPKSRARLSALLGEYPDASTAAIWKRELKRLRDEEGGLFAK
jgi:hypothetical protein